MNNYKLEVDEVLMMEDLVLFNGSEKEFNLSLTSKNVLIENDKNIIKVTNLNDIKIFRDKIQLSQKGKDVKVQTVNEIYDISFSNVIKATSFISKITDILTTSTVSSRSVEKIKKSFDTVDDVLGFDTRNTLKGVLENGIPSSLIKGIKKNKLK